jgi:6-phosphogluconolactonase
MKTTRRTFLAAAAWTPVFAQALRAGGAQDGGERLLYVGTYTNNAAGSRGIYAWRFNPSTGRVTSLGVAAETPSPSFLAVHPDKRFLYAVNELMPQGSPDPTGEVSAFAIDAASGKLTLLNSVKSRGLAPAHLLVDPTGKWVVIGNYGNGQGSEGTSIASFAIAADGRLATEPASFIPHPGKPNAEGRLVAHPHCVALSPDARFLLVAEKGQNEITVYRWNGATGELTPNDPGFVEAVRPGSGPRHLTFGKDGRFVYLCNEQGRSVSTFSYDPARGALALLDTQSTLPADAPQTGSTAEIEVHPDGAFLYVSNRGHNSLALFGIDQATGRLTARGHFPTGGRTPRNFKIDPTGDYVFAENQASNLTVVMRVDRRTGALTPTEATLDTPAPVCIVFV